MIDDLTHLRNELDKLYKNWVVINGRAGRLIEEKRVGGSLSDPIFSFLYREWKQAGAYGSSYGDHIAKAIRAIDPEWSQEWANHAALLVLEPDAVHSPPVVSSTGKRPSNAFQG